LVNNKKRDSWSEQLLHSNTNSIKPTIKTNNYFTLIQTVTNSFHFPVADCYVLQTDSSPNQESHKIYVRYNFKIPLCTTLYMTIYELYMVCGESWKINILSTSHNKSWFMHQHFPTKIFSKPLGNMSLIPLMLWEKVLSLSLTLSKEKWYQNCSRMSSAETIIHEIITYLINGRPKQTYYKVNKDCLSVYQSSLVICVHSWFCLSVRRIAPLFINFIESVLLSWSLLWTSSRF
jgi:hypothetical protein